MELSLQCFYSFSDHLSVQTLSGPVTDCSVRVKNKAHDKDTPRNSIVFYFRFSRERSSVNYLLMRLLVIRDMEDNEGNKKNLEQDSFVDSTIDFRVILRLCFKTSPGTKLFT